MAREHWRFGKDPTCLARIHPGNATVSTPKTLSYRTGLELRKARDGNASPKSGWIQISQEDFQILAQEKDPVSGLPVIQFMPDPSAPDRVQARQAADRARARERVGLEHGALKSVVKEVLAEAGLIPAAEPEPAPSLDEPSEEVAPEAASSEDTSSGLSLDDEVEAAPKPRRKRSTKKKRKSRLTLDEE